MSTIQNQIENQLNKLKSKSKFGEELLAQNY